MPRALILIGNGFEDIEALYPFYRLLEAGFEVHIAAPTTGQVSGKHGYTLDATVKIEDVNPEEYDVLVLPGGRGPERIRVRSRENAARIVEHFMDTDKPVAAICHGPQLLVTAGKASGKRLTSYPGIRDDLEAAGAIWVDEPVVVDGNLVTSRVPSDIPFWMREFFRILGKRGLLSPIPPA